jgi:ribosome-associated toxin RatA of RatAB toxin-antitoxin module
MPVLNVSASARVPAPAATVYDLIADYKQGHPRILPPQYFEGLDVLEGGGGAGTRIRYTMKAFGTRETSHARVTEPEPGRVLVESVEERPVTTTFTVEAMPDDTTRVTFATEYRTQGLRGWFESLMVPGYLRKVYAAELALLEQRAVAASSRIPPATARER